MSSKNTINSLYFTEEKSHKNDLGGYVDKEPSKKSMNQTITSSVKQVIPQILYNHQFQEKRKEIFTETKISVQISLCYDLILYNRNNLNDLIEDGSILTISNTPNTFRLFLDYYYNYLLLFNLFYANGDIQNCFKTLSHLESEREKYSANKYVCSLLYNKRYKYSNDTLDYVNFLSCVVHCTRKITRNYLYENALLAFVEFIEKIPTSKIYIPHLYFFLGEILIQKDYLKTAAFCYDFSYKALLPISKILRATSLLVTNLINEATVNFVIGEENKAVELLNEAKKIKSKEVSDQGYEDKQLRKIYLCLLEFCNKEKSDEVYEYISFIKNSIKYYSEEKKKIISFILDSINKSDSMKNITNPLPNKCDDFVTFCLKKNYEKTPTSSKDVEVSEIQKFFLLLTTLSIYQLDLLNREQPSQDNLKKFKSLPIYFSDTFRESLNLDQTKLLNSIKTLSLKRGSVLKNISSKISIENLNLNKLYKYIMRGSDKVENKVLLSSLNNIQNVSSKLNQYDIYLSSLSVKDNKVSSTPKISTLLRSDSIPEFRYQKRISYDLIKAALKKALSQNSFYGKSEDLIKDSVVIGVLNRMSYRDISYLKENPEWLIEVLLEYQEKNNIEIKSNINKSDAKITEKAEEENKEKDVNTFSDEDEQNQLKSIEEIDAMGM